MISLQQERLAYQRAIVVAQLWFGMVNIQPRLPFWHHQEVLQQLRRLRIMASLASLRSLQKVCLLSSAPSSQTTL